MDKVTAEEFFKLVEELMNTSFYDSRSNKIDINDQVIAIQLARFLLNSSTFEEVVRNAG